MGWLDRAVERGVKAGFDRFFKSGEFDKLVDDVVREELRKPKYAWFWFVKHMQARLLEVDRSLSAKRSFQIAKQAYREFLKDEKIEFGDPRYDWTRHGARELIHAYEIDHWESRP